MKTTQSFEDREQIDAWAVSKATEIYRTGLYRSDPTGVRKHLNELKQLYRLYRLNKGCELAEEAKLKVGADPDIIRWWALFHNRSMQWFKVREVLQPLITTSSRIHHCSNNMELLFESRICRFRTGHDLLIKPRGNYRVAQIIFNNVILFGDLFTGLRFFNTSE